MTACSSLQDFVDRARSLFILTGAGCSTSSGIPDYRDADGKWKRLPPVTYQAFMGDEATRRRYWARSLIGWRRFRRARPNDAHRALTRLEAMGKSEVLLTQNVDRLHQAVGSARVIDLHGRLDLVRCMSCGRRMSRATRPSRAPTQSKFSRRSPTRRSACSIRMTTPAMKPLGSEAGIFPKTLVRRRGRTPEIIRRSSRRAIRRSDRRRSPRRCASWSGNERPESFHSRLQALGRPIAFASPFCVAYGICWRENAELWRLDAVRERFRSVNDRKPAARREAIIWNQSQLDT